LFKFNKSDCKIENELFRFKVLECKNGNGLFDFKGLKTFPEKKSGFLMY
jgi:hypothetical protein